MSALFAGFLDELIASGAVTSAVALAGSGEGIEWIGAAGPAVTPSTRYDFGSLTKPFIATLAVGLDASGELALDLPVGDIFPAADRRLAGAALADLLCHDAGFAAWAPLYRHCASAGEVLAFLLSGGNGRLFGAPPATYSDLDYILWTRAAEARLGRPVWDLLAERVLAPLGLATVTLAPGDQPDVAFSRLGTGQEVALAAEQGIEIADLGAPARGEVQDGNARFLAKLGIPLPGNAGLFGRAADLWALGVEWLHPGRLLTEAARNSALRRGRGLYALGWVRRNVEGSAGPVIGPAAFGHSGFAGGSLWIDPDRQRLAVLLAARSAPEVDLNHWRRRFHALVYDVAGTPQS